MISSFINITYFSLQKPMRQINGREESDGCERENCQSAWHRRILPMLQVPNNDNKKKELLTVYDI